MDPVFTAHNIRLDDGRLTRPEAPISFDAHPWVLSAKRVLASIFPGDKMHLRLADLGCLEGGFAVEFARMGFQVLGIEVRESNIQACQFVKSRVALPNLNFAHDDAWNIGTYGPFDAVFCSGLLYHFDRPKQFLETVSAATRKLLILRTHYATGGRNLQTALPRPLRAILTPILKRLGEPSLAKHLLSGRTEHESLPGRWYVEFSTDKQFSRREQMRWSSWDNRRSFWVQREYLIQAIHDVGFDLVLEQFDTFAPDIAQALWDGYQKTEGYGTFVGVKTAEPLSMLPGRGA